MSVIKEFREFALKGSVVDLAVGVMIGAAFGAIVSSLVDDIIMPPIGVALAGIDFSTLKIVLRDTVPAVGAPTDANYVKAVPEAAINYGKFLNAALKFLIVAWVLFWVIKGVNVMKRRQEAAPTPAEQPADVKLLTEIRDLLKAK